MTLKASALQSLRPAENNNPKVHPNTNHNDVEEKEPDQESDAPHNSANPEDNSPKKPQTKDNAAQHTTGPTIMELLANPQIQRKAIKKKQPIIKLAKITKHIKVKIEDDKSQSNPQGSTDPSKPGTGYPLRCPKCKTNTWRNIKPRFHTPIPNSATEKKDYLATFSCNYCPPYYQPEATRSSYRRYNVADALCGTCSMLVHRCRCKYDEITKQQLLTMGTNSR